MSHSGKKEKSNKRARRQVTDISAAFDKRGYNKESSEENYDTSTSSGSSEKLRAVRTKERKKAKFNFRRSPRLSPSPQRWIVPRGLQNLGNTCFLNSIIQCLASNPAFRKHLQSDYFSRMLMGGSLSKLIRDINRGQPPPSMKPKDLLEKMILEDSKYRFHEQHDAAETLSLILNRVMLEEVYEGQAFKTLYNVLNISSRAVISCSKCQFESVRIDDALILALPIVRKKKQLTEFGSLYDSLGTFVAPEVIESYQCSLCSNLVDAQRSERIVVAPPTMIFQLRRFEMQPSGRFGVVHGSVDFPDKLCLDNYIIDGENSKSGYNYELTGVCVHMGTLTSGHYKAYTKADDSTWVCCDDSRVYEVRKETVFTSQAYLLFYQRQFRLRDRSPLNKSMSM